MSLHAAIAAVLASSGVAPESVASAISCNICVKCFSLGFFATFKLFQNFVMLLYSSLYIPADILHAV